MQLNKILSSSKEQDLHYIARSTNPSSILDDLQFHIIRSLVSASFSDTLMSGSLGVTSGSSIVTGDGSTEFTTQVGVGDTIRIVGPKDIYLLSGSFTSSFRSTQITGDSGSTQFDTQLKSGDGVKIKSGTTTSYHIVELTDSKTDGTSLSDGPFSVSSGSNIVSGVSGSTDFYNNLNDGDTIKLTSGSYSSYHIVTHSFDYSPEETPLSGNHKFYYNSGYVSGSGTNYLTSLTGSFTQASPQPEGTSTGGTGFRYKGTRVRMVSPTYSQSAFVGKIFSNTSMSVSPVWSSGSFGDSFMSSSNLFREHDHRHYKIKIYPSWIGNTTSSVIITKQNLQSSYSMSISPRWNGLTTTNAEMYKTILSSSQDYTVNEIQTNTKLILSGSYIGNTDSELKGYTLGGHFVTLPPMTIVSSDLWKSEIEKINAEVPNEATSSKFKKLSAVTSSARSATIGQITSSMINNQVRLRTIT